MENKIDVITDSHELSKRVDALRNERFVTIDTEFLREKTYYSLLCLIQIAGENDAFAIDPLAKDIDLSALYDLFDDENIIKVFHACGQDIEIILQKSESIPTPLFDTQVAAQVLGLGESAAYGTLVSKICKISLDKSSRYTDWSKRPLSEKQIDYAISDVTHLRDVFLYLEKKLDELGRTSWLEEEMKKFLDISFYQPAPEEMWRKIKIKTDDTRFLAIVRELAKWRELYAQKTDRPRPWILKDDAILEIASVAPDNTKDLQKLRFFSTGKKNIADEIIKAVEVGKVAEPPKVQKKKSLPKGSIPLMELLKVLLKMQCDIHNVAPSIVAKTHDLEKIASLVNPEKKDEILAMHGWRYDVFGKYAIALKSGKLALTAQGNKMMLIEPEYS